MTVVRELTNRLATTECPSRAFELAMEGIARKVDPQTYLFDGDATDRHGYVQLGHSTDSRVLIHRLWARVPGGGTGSRILRAVCAIADEARVELSLKPLPFGVKPYPISKVELATWYGRHGFSGSRFLVRRPR